MTGEAAYFVQRFQVAAALLLLAATLYLSGCTTAREALHLDPKLQERNEGYSLLYQLVGQESDVRMLLAIKSERDEVNSLINQISDSAGKATAMLDSFREHDRRLSFDLEPLPMVERAARKSIESANGKALLGSGGREFEVQLLLSQASALEYGAHLARGIAAMDSNTTRKDFLETFAQQWLDLREKVLRLLVK